MLCKHIATLNDNNPCLTKWQQLVTCQSISYTIPAHPLNRQGETEGILIGGNLSVLYGLQGTPYSLTNCIQKHKAEGKKTLLFIEDISERHYHIDRMMQNLRLSGVLAQISGLIVGQFSECDNDPSILQQRPSTTCFPQTETIYQTILRAVEQYDYPTLFDFPAGHVDNNFPFMLGAYTKVHISSNSSNFLQP